MQGYKLALKNYYKDKKITFPVELDQWLDDYVNCYKRIVADKRASGVMNAWKGKRPLTFFGYTVLSLVLMSLLPKGNKYPWKDSMFGWCFETLAWNVIARCSTIIELHLCHLDWREDALVIIVNKHKGDIQGEKAFQKKSTCMPTRPNLRFVQF